MKHLFASAVVAALTLAATPSLAEDLKITVASPVTPPSLHNLYLHVAYEKGFFKKHGIEVVDFMQLRGGPLATQAVVAGQADITATDPEGVLQAAVAGHPIRAVSAPGAHLSYYVAVRSSIKSLKDLEGKAFAVSRPGAISQYLMFPALAKENVPPDSIQWLSVGGGRERMLALLADRVAGALLHLDFALEAAKDKNITLLSRVADSLPNYPFELLVVRKDLIEKNPKAVEAITAAVIEACRYIVTNKEGTLEVFRKYSPNADAALTSEAYDALLAMNGFGVDGGLTAENANIAMTMALQNKFLKAPVPLDAWVYLTAQEQALKELGPFKK